MVILGIDPGTRRVGYGVVEKTQRGLTYLRAGLLNIKGKGRWMALQEIRTEVVKLIKKFEPDILAVERLYFAKNQKTGIEVAHARGVILLCGVEYKLEIKEYGPNEVKAGLTGYGFADKQAVAKMVKLSLHNSRISAIDDVSDALAVAILAAETSGLDKWKR